MTYRERRERKAQRLQQWADKREEKAAQSIDGAFDLVSGIAPGQPILVGHHSEQAHRSRLAKHDDKMRQGFEHRDKAEAMRERAGNIAEQLERSIYDDDPDAIEQLKARIGELEAHREAIKAYNASCRHGQPNPELLTPKYRRDLESTKQHTPAFLGKNGAMPGYVLTNLGGNIRRNQQRLTKLERRRQRQG